MDAKSVTKTFECKHHPKEQIQRICSELDCENPLCCIDCILSTHGVIHKESLVSINEFVDKISKHYETLRRIKSNEDAPPYKFTDFLSKEDENLEKLSQHVENQKSFVEQSINEILDSFTSLCHKTKQELHQKFDNQVHNLKANYKFYKNKLNKFYSKNDADDCNPTKEDILTRLNRAQTREEYEFIFKNIKDDVADSKIESTYEQKVKDITDSLQDMSEMLKDQTINLPKLSFLVESNTSDLVKEFQEKVGPFLAEKLEITNNIYEFNTLSTVSIDSKLVKSEQARLLKKWITNGSVKFKLVYRGSRDGFTASSFHSKCDKIKPSITLIQSNANNKIFGGFTDQDWTVTNQYKNSKNAFVFSVTEKEKFFLKSNMQQYSTYSHQSYLAAFGGGMDFYLCDNCNTVGSSYSNFGHSYDNRGKAREFLSGTYNFTVKEIEVFQVEYTGELLVNVKDEKGKKKK